MRPPYGSVREDGGIIVVCTCCRWCTEGEHLAHDSATDCTCEGECDYDGDPCHDAAWATVDAVVTERDEATR